ncbi:MAG: beta-N-acetylhexosaminidase [Actinomycetota bacterium]
MTAAEHLRRHALGVVMPGFVGTTLPGWLRESLEEGLGGICLFADNIEEPTQLEALTAAIHAANPDAVVAIDEEGGDVSRLHQRGGSPFPGNAVLGRIGDVEATRAVAYEVGTQLAAVGIDLTLAPDADVNSNPANPVIGVRSFGADPIAVAAHTAAWTSGVQQAGVAACAKHFPGHGDTSTDSHVSEPVLSADLATIADRELVPFRAAISAGTRAVMTSHIRVPALDADTIATFSRPILDDLLRGRLGFEGVVVTDALDMAGASRRCGIPAAAVVSVAAGADLVCLGSNTAVHDVRNVVEALMLASGDDDLTAERLSDAAGRCRALTQWAVRQRRELAATDAERNRPVTTAQVIESFSLSHRAAAMIASNVRPVRWVEIEAEPHVAIGDAPLGPFFPDGVTPSLTVSVDDRSFAADCLADADVLTVVVGRDLHRDETAFAAATAIAERCDGLIVDLGWAHTQRVDIATFGSSRLIGEALIDLVSGSA